MNPLCLSIISVRLQGNKKPLLIGMRRGKAARSSHLFPAAVGSGWNWHLVIEDRASTGCRGFIGPVPQPLLMRFVISTNTDRMIYEAGSVNRFFWFNSTVVHPH